VTTTFLGIDLAWQSDRNPTGAVALREDAGSLVAIEAAPSLRTLTEVEDFIARHVADRTVIAIDGPLVIPNASGQRACELALSRQFGARHASCHSSNTTLYPHAASVRLEARLASLSFVHAGTPFGERVMLEVYPHAAYVALFDLPSIIRYKKGSAAEKCAGLRIVQQRLAQLPFRHDLVLADMLERDPASLKGQARKSFEDLLDGLFCAYLAYHYWKHGPRAWQVFGSASDGYIANPAVSLAGLGVAAA
jgi:predicted RNase H-like nuclease